MDAERQKSAVEEYATRVLAWLRTQPPRSLAEIAEDCGLPNIDTTREVVHQLMAQGLVVLRDRRYAAVRKSVRACLGCGRSFSSEGPWNRLCGECRERDPGKRRYKTVFPGRG